MKRREFLFGLSALPLMTALPRAAAAQVRIIRNDPRFDAFVPPEATVETIVDGHTWVEGPLWNPREGYLLFSDIPRNSVYRWSRSSGVSLFLKPSGYTGAEPFTGKEPGSNGLTYDSAHRLVLAEHGDRRVARLESDGRKTTLADRYHGKRINSPNDVVFKSNGDLYFTDPPFGLPGAFDDPRRELDFCGVYRLKPSGELTLLTKDAQAPNGITFAPDEKTLYISDSKQGLWLAFPVKSDGTLADARVLADAKPLQKQGPGVPDGMKVDRHGNIFGAGPGAIYVIAPEGSVLGAFHTGGPTSNVAWGDDGSTLYITADHSVYRVRLVTRGA